MASNRDKHLLPPDPYKRPITGRKRKSKGHRIQAPTTKSKRQMAKQLGKSPDEAFFLTKEQVEHALLISFSNITQASKVFKYNDGSPIPRATFGDWVRQYGIDPYDHKHLKNTAQMGIDVLLKLVMEGKEKSLHKMLDTWGKYVNFVPPPKAVTLHATTGNPYDDALCMIDPAYSARRQLERSKEAIDVPTIPTYQLEQGDSDD